MFIILNVHVFVLNKISIIKAHTKERLNIILELEFGMQFIEKIENICQRQSCTKLYRLRQKYRGIETTGVFTSESLLTSTRFEV